MEANSPNADFGSSKTCNRIADGRDLPFAASTMNDVDETYILLLLADSNLPTGSFVASSGLESYMKHGFGKGNVTAFVRDSLSAYGRSALPFVSDAHRLTMRYRDAVANDLESLVKDLAALEELYDVITLNHVARRASKAQGVALLTLYTKAFSPPVTHSSTDQAVQQNDARMAAFFARYKTMVRREDAHGHLPTCWGALTAALGLTLGIPLNNGRRLLYQSSLRKSLLSPPIPSRQRAFVGVRAPK